MLAVVHPVLTDRRTSVRRKPFEARGIRRWSGDDGRVVHRATLFKRVVHAGDRGALLADRDVDAPHLLLGIAALPVLPLVEDGVNTDRGLAGLAVADDQLALAAPDRSLRVNRLDTGLQRFLDALALHPRRGLNLQRATGFRLDVAAAVDRMPERIDHTAQELIPDRDRQHLTGALDLLALRELFEIAENNRTNVVLVEVQGYTQHPALEFEQFLRHHGRQALDVRDAVAGVDDGADLLTRRVGGEAGDVLLDRTLDVVGRNRQLCHGFSSSCLRCGSLFAIKFSRATDSGPPSTAMTASRRSRRRSRRLSDLPTIWGRSAVARIPGGRRCGSAPVSADCAERRSVPRLRFSSRRPRRAARQPTASARQRIRRLGPRGAVRLSAPATLRWWDSRPGCC